MSLSSKKSLTTLYTKTFAREPLDLQTLRADGSNRELYRLLHPDGGSVIGVHGPDAAENRAFVAYSRQLRSADLPVPEIYAYDQENHVYLEEDLGDTTLYQALSDSRTDDQFPPKMIAHYKRVVEILPRFQVEGGRVLDFSLAYPRAEFDRRSMLWDLHYFKYMFLKLIGAPFDEERLEDDFERLTDFLLKAEIRHFLYRDFQSRNIMLRRTSGTEITPWFIDYQGGRRGALQYDIASLLYDAKANIPDTIREELLEHYLTALETHTPVDRSNFLELYPGFVLMRALQALGAYGYRGLYEGKEHFVSSIPFGVTNVLRQLNADFSPALPELTEVFEWLKGWDHNDVVTKGRVHVTAPVLAAQSTVPSHSSAPLSVHVTSFSYKKGSYPEDSTEHGGGFVFDCRSLHNPGRFAEFANLTGRDNHVANFLSGREDVEKFWQNIRQLTARTVERYSQRGFDYLSIAFGCTGGQHRSVYFAERLVDYMQEQYPHIAIHLEHRELDI